MEVTKKQIVDGVSAFIDNCLMPSTSDGQMKLVLTMAKDSLRKNHETIDKFLDNPMISSIITEDNGMYDISRFIQVMKETFDDNEYYPITIPSIPIVSPQERVLKISEPHFDKLVNYIQPPSAPVINDE